ncbi:Hypothetical_protein [Hexamita inflata]|uniref:Hypothetical_protein n=1 Tax=Hexamita inflata TaxID=28002 RepID=A0AA86UPR1_9EUKA|nr:Hypothetical protein HINF_LOCUS47492 [Hexamita inflata]
MNQKLIYEHKTGLDLQIIVNMYQNKIYQKQDLLLIIAMQQCVSPSNCFLKKITNKKDILQHNYTQLILLLSTKRCPEQTQLVPKELTEILRGCLTCDNAVRDIWLEKHNQKDITPQITSILVTLFL